MGDYFSDNEISFQPISTPNSGFRPGQRGALHATLSHFSVYEEPATLCLPTGYGKTAVMMALPFILKAQRVLVVEPSEALRKQTSGHFKALSTLKKIKIADRITFLPKVIGQKGRPATAAEWEALRGYDVVVSTPQSTSPNITPDAPADLFDLVIFDEAHHAPAESWSAYLAHFSKARFVFLTATPFRRDRKPIPGRLAYWYPVLKASREKAFGKVHFTAAPVKDDRNEEEIDRSVAATAVAQLKRDRDNGLDHRIFARAATIASAKSLVDLYTAAGAKVSAITSHLSPKRQDEIEAHLIDGTLDGVVCVDMFGEGYDFPKLKIAALHAPHKSLVPTLQFIGRFARTNDQTTGDATFVAPLSRLKDANIRLFQEGIDIAELIDDAAQAQIADAEANRAILDILKPRRQMDSDYDAVTPLLLELYAHARIFECSQRPDLSLFNETVGRNLLLVKQWTSDDGLITLLLTIDNSPPNWATSDVIANVRHDAFLLAYNEASQLCFIGSTRRTDRLYIGLMDTVCKDQHRPISFERTRRALAGLTDLRFYNVGLRNTTLNTQTESYRTVTGPRAERAMTAGDARAYVQGHFFGSGVIGDDRETIGASSSSRIWSNQRLTVAEYLDWITALNKRLSGHGAIAPSQLDIVQHAKTLRGMPDQVIAGGWNKLAYRAAPKVRLRQGTSAWRYLQVTDLEIDHFEVHPDKQRLEFQIRTDDFGVKFEFQIGGGAIIRQVDHTWSVEVQSGVDDWTELATWMSMHPPVFYAADKSSFQGMNLMRPPSVTISALADGDTSTLDWTGCAIGVEWDAAKAKGALTVHQFLEQHLTNTPHLEALLYDHRSGEAADFIAVHRNGEQVRVSLYHCKSAGGDPSGGRVNDVYEVAGQVLKSVAYCEPGILREHVEHRTNKGKQSQPSRFVVGDLALMQRALLDTAPDKLTFEIYGVQPGIAQSKIDAHLADLMAFGLEYVQRGGAAKAAWIVSP
jgi:superfamily II DNA or RNA helicase